MGLATGMTGGAAVRARTQLTGDLNLSHSINNGVIFCLGAHPAGSPLLGRDLVSRLSGTLLGGGALTGSYTATGWKCFESFSTSTDGIYWSVANQVGLLGITTACTIFAYMSLDTVIADSHIMRTSYVAQDYASFNVQNQNDANNRGRLTYRNSAEAVKYHISADNTIITGLHSFAVTRTGSTVVSYLDGVAQTPVAEDLDTDAIRWDGATLPFVIFNTRSDSPASGLDGRALRIQIANRAFSGAEIASLHATPTLGLYE